nr:larval cuticle protein A2B-like [Onthophagus taurus]
MSLIKFFLIFIAVSGIESKLLEYDTSHQNYQWGYDIQDEITGDFKSQEERKEGDILRGFYSFIEADGSKRIVRYIVHPKLGFNAIVLKERAKESK